MIDEQTAGMLIFVAFLSAFMASAYLSRWVSDVRRERRRRRRQWW